ncbi:MAG: Fructose-2,6-bisphosphatase [Idiomarinaceae bacterium HL-53]|nr:MAG: Fructose-2,6-bisphosphatase [Idiomarinaceae bacterium HL-53]CUS48861.1 Broad specificity phosphatase PhoE [Idiomarinaceae bacterium HL-53]
MIVTLVRHGQASFHADDYDELSSLGYSQAQRLAEMVATFNDPIDAMVTGTLKRHQQTANTFLTTLGKPIAASEHCGWNEFDHRDVLKEYVLANPSARADVLSREPERVLPVLAEAIGRWQQVADGYKENWNVFEERVQAAWLYLLNTYAEKKHIWVFTSGGPIATSIIQALEVEQTHMVGLNTKLMNTSLTRFYCESISANNMKIHLLSYNEHTHLTGQYAHLRSYR